MTQRTCVDCGTGISGSNPAVKRCPECCADIMRAAGVEPLEPYPGTNHRRWRCRCLVCGQTVSPRLGNVQQGHRGCEFCARRAQAETRCAPESEAVAAMRAAGLEPLEPYHRSHHRWKCQCMKCGAVVMPVLHNIRSGWGGCWACSYDERGEAQRMDELKAISAMQAAGLEPLDPYQGTNTKWRSKCVRCERIVNPTLHNVKSGHNGCMYCGGRFRDFEDALVYLIQHQQLGAVKIGIMKATSNRLVQHRRLGWCVVETICVHGGVAMETESHILTWWRDDLGLLPCLGPSEMPRGGWTETATASEVDLVATVRKMHEVATS